MGLKLRTRISLLMPPFNSLMRGLVAICVAATTCSLQAIAAEADDANPDRPIKDKWAVVIGVSKFANSTIPSLRYPAKDAQDFCNFLVSREKFARDHVLLLTNEQATKVRILEAFGDGWLPQRVMKDDLVLLYISTHGSPADKAGENFICAYDSDPEHPYATGIRLQDLSKELQVRTSCDRLVLLLDACHSGAAATTEQKGLVRAPTNFKLDAITGSGQLVISSSRSDQSSWESKRYANGVFTGKLMEALQKRGAETTLDEAFTHLKQGVETEVRFDRMADQSPIMLDKWKGAELALAAPASEPRMVPPDLPSENTSSNPVNAQPVHSYPEPNSLHPAQIRPQPTTPKPTNSAAVTNQRNYGSLPIFMTSSWLDNQGDPTLENGTRVLTEDDIRGLTAEQISWLYNEAYARHGRGFLNSNIAKYFSQQGWYREDPDYHWRPTDPKVRSRHGQSDDNLVINERRTPKQSRNIQFLKGHL